MIRMTFGGWAAEAMPQMKTEKLRTRAVIFMGLGVAKKRLAAVTTLKQVLCCGFFCSRREMPLKKPR
jgi:hypothetical protein